MVVLKPVISVREIPPAFRIKREFLPSIHDYVSNTSHSDENRMLSYLKQGVVCGVYPDPCLFRDVFDPSIKIPYYTPVELGEDTTNSITQIDVLSSLQPNLLMTDGTWLWPAALIYYLEEYHLQLPDAFLSHAREVNWCIDRSSIVVCETDTTCFDKLTTE